MRNRMILAAAVLTVPAVAPAAAQSLLDRVGRQVGERVANTILGGGSQAESFGDTDLQPGGSIGFDTYGDWQIKLERIERGSDDGWQAIIGVRNSAAHRQGLVASSVKLFLISEDGEALQNWGELYRASVEGSATGLEPVSGTLWLEPGDVTRVRLRFDGSRRFKPARVRIQSTGATSEARTFPVSG